MTQRNVKQKKKKCLRILRLPKILLHINFTSQRRHLGFLETLTYTIRLHGFRFRKKYYYISKNLLLVV